MYICISCLCDNCEFLEVCEAPKLKKTDIAPQPCTVCMRESKKNAAYRYMPAEYEKCEYKEFLKKVK